MRTVLVLIGSVLTAAGLFLMSVGCDQKPASDDASTREGEKSREDLETDLEASLVGHWLPDPEATTAEIGKALGESASTAPMLKEMKEFLSRTAVEVTSDTVTVHNPGAPDIVPYKVSAVDLSKGRLGLTFSENDTEIAGSATIQGNRLVLEKPPNVLILDRISPEDFKKHLKHPED